MKLEYGDIKNKHKNTPCVVALHGPSLNNHKDKTEELQQTTEHSQHLPPWQTPGLDTICFAFLRGK